MKVETLKKFEDLVESEKKGERIYREPGEVFVANKDRFAQLVERLPAGYVREVIEDAEEETEPDEAGAPEEDAEEESSEE